MDNSCEIREGLDVAYFNSFKKDKYNLRIVLIMKVL